ncbi:MAG TPA: lipoate--protein ligase [Balneolales bacterium]|nr:lipoate--protein ligase [Balneolales bacterium]
MIFIDNENITDPRINLAIEEYALRNLFPDDDLFLFYINRPSIIIGRNQNTLEEINYDYVRKKGITVVRRISGGGAVYHDQGNLNFSFIKPYSPSRLNNFLEFTQPIIEVLRDLGIPAELSGRNDLVVDGLKISGNAQHSTKSRMFSHGTLLFDSDLNEVVESLNVKMTKIKSKGMKSIRSRVSNISRFLKRPIDIQQLRDRIKEAIFQGSGSHVNYHLTEDDWQRVRELSNIKYANWNWNFGNSPTFNVRRSHRFDIGEVDLRIDVEKGHVQDLKIYGDFLGKNDVSILEKAVIGRRYDADDIEDVLKLYNVNDFFGKVTHKEIRELFIGDELVV